VSDLLRQQQFTMARYLRDPSRHVPPPGIEARRLRVYRELFFNSIESLLAGSFPVIRETLGEARWKVLVQAFYSTHRSRTPLFPQVAGEFVDYLETRSDDRTLPPWLHELAHYEWVEQALWTSDASIPAHDRHGDLLDGVPVLSPLAIALAYRWPVTDIGPGHVPKVAPQMPLTLLVHRDTQHEVRFTRIAPLVYRLLTALQSSEQRTGREHIAALAREVGAEEAQLQEHALPFLRQLHVQGVVLGTGPTSNPVFPTGEQPAPSGAVP
jgi:uncharacterized protein